METQTIKFDEVQLSKINLSFGDVLSVKLVGDDFGPEVMESLKSHLETVFPLNKIIVFTMPKNTDIVFEAVKTGTSFCEDCDCGKKEQNNG